MSEEISYAILRIGKIKSLDTLDAVEWHNSRRIPAGTVEGLPPPEDLVKMTGTYRERFARVLMQTGAICEEGKVLAVEVLVTASPEWWEKAARDEKEEWWRAQLRFANDLFGPGLIAFTPHVDGSTPHAQFVGLPLYHDIKRKRGAKPKTAEAMRKREAEEACAAKIWRLSHDRVFGGSAERLAKLQTTYHGYVKHLGLARGRDTVGVGIKHTTLKHYKKLLTQTDRDLAREAVEQHEKRQVLERYDAELREKYDRFYKDRLELFRQEQEFRAKREAFEAHQYETESWATTLDVRQRSLEERKKELEEGGLALRTRALAEAEANVARQQRIAAQHDLLDERSQQASRREEYIAMRERSAEGREHDLRAEELRQQSIKAQLSIITGFFTGRLSGRWDNRDQLPQVAKGELTLEERVALAQPWPELLGLAVRRAAQMTAARSALAQKFYKILGLLRRKRREAQYVLADANERAAEAAEKETRAKSIMAAAHRNESDVARALNISISRLAQAHEERAQAETARDVAATAEREAKRLRGEAESDAAVLRSEVATLRTEQLTVTANIATWREERRTLDSDVARWKADKQRIETELLKLERDRQEHAQAVARLTLSWQLVERLFANEICLEATGATLRVSPGPEAPNRDPTHVAKTKIEPWVENIAGKHRDLLFAIGRAEEVEQSLKKRRAALAARYPERAEELRTEQTAETKEIDKRLMRLPPGRDGVGL